MFGLDKILSIGLPVINTLLGAILPNSGMKANMQGKLAAKLETIEKKIDISPKKAAENVETELKSKRWIISSWRGVLMFSITIAFINDIILYPFMVDFFGEWVKTGATDFVWKMLMFGLLGYFGG
jgi:hypothetical protein